MNHTPGPWKFGLGRPSVGFILYGSDGFVIARREVEETTERNEEMTANARLIAAAPELYEALRDLFEAVVIPEEISIEAGCKARIRARDILLKLRGEEGGENA